MGEVAGAGLLAHVPTIMLPYEQRLELNEGKEISLVTGLQRLRAEVFEALDYDTVVVLDSHWHTTVEFVVAAQQMRAGLFTSDELPRGMCRIPYEWHGDPGLAQAIAGQGDPHGTWITAIDDPCLPVHYATVNLWHYLGRGLGKRWISMSTAQTGDTEDFLRAGRALGAAIAQSDRAVLLVASGAMSHTFWSLRELRAHEASDTAHIRTAEARTADTDRIAWLQAGDHARVIDTMPEFLAFRPEARFAHYLMMIAALGEGAVIAPGRPFSDYENSVGTGQMHIWFDRPAAGWCAPGSMGQAAREAGWAGCLEADRGRLPMAEYRRILLDGSCVQVRRDGDELVAGDGRRVAAADAVHLPPVVPSKIVAVHLNHRSRVTEFGATLPPAPTYFHKPTSALVGHGGAVVRPEGCRYLNYEGEVAIVIGRTCRGVPPSQAGEYIAGYTIANDFGLHDFRDTDAGSMLRVKGSDTMAPLGPGLVTGWDFHGKRLRTYVNGRLAQDGSTDEMQWDMHYLVADIARTITLCPGDVLLSGTPANSRPVQPGDVVEVEVDGLGRLANHIVAGPAAVPADFGAQPTASEEVISTALGGDWEFRGIRPPIRA